MDPEKAEVFEAVILDHNASPKRFGRLDLPSHQAIAYNPICGDRFTVYLRIEDDIVVDAAFEGNGCAVSKASLSMMMGNVYGRDIHHFERLFEVLSHRLQTPTTTQEPPYTETWTDELESLLAVRNAPTRIRCALLGWDAMRSALSEVGPESQESSGKSNTS